MTIQYESDSAAVFNPIQSFAYPAANAQNSGQLNSEENIKWIMLRLTRRSFTLTPDDFKLSRTTNTKFTISKGDANIDGYHFKCKEDTIIDITDEAFMNDELRELLQNATSESTAIILYVKFKENVDAAGHLITYETDTETGKMSNFRGFEIFLTNVKPETDEFYLGYLTVYTSSGSPYISKVTNNIYKCMFLNTSNIFADDDNLGETERTVNNLIKYLITKIFGEGLDGDIITYGNKNNGDKTTNILLSNKDIKSYLRFYYDADSKIGGVGIINSLDNIFKRTVVTNDIDIVKFDLDSGDTTNPKRPYFHIFPLDIMLGAAGGQTTISGSLHVGEDIQVDGNYSSETGDIALGRGNIVTNGTISGSKVFGAVWS